LQCHNQPVELTSITVMTANDQQDTTDSVQGGTQHKADIGEEEKGIGTEKQGIITQEQDHINEDISKGNGKAAQKLDTSD